MARLSHWIEAHATIRTQLIDCLLKPSEAAPPSLYCTRLSQPYWWKENLLRFHKASSRLKFLFSTKNSATASYGPPTRPKRFKDGVSVDIRVLDDEIRADTDEILVGGQLGHDMGFAVIRIQRDQNISGRQIFADVCDQI